LSLVPRARETGKLKNMSICHITDEKIPSTETLMLADYVIPRNYRFYQHKAFPRVLGKANQAS